MFVAICDRQPRSRMAWLGSVGLHVAAVMLLVILRGVVLAPSAHRTNKSFVFTPTTAPHSLEPLLRSKPKLRNFDLPKLRPPEPAKVATSPVMIDAPVIRIAGSAPVLQTAPAVHLPPPSHPIRTGVLDSPPQAKAPESRPAPAIQTGAFSANVANEPKQNTRAVLQSAGFGGLATQDPPKPGRSKDLPQGTFGGVETAVLRNDRKSVSAGGFEGPGTALIAAPGLPRQQSMARAGFGDALLASRSAPNRHQPEESDSLPVEITFKPRPEYTTEGRRLQIEGEVALEVVFKASGEVEIVRIIRGLGHGLNESAVAAARCIRFRPARKQGRSLDSAATVRMTFELAY
jgi:TonB family protein